MGHRVVKRVPLDFDWPINKTWHGFLMPDPGWPQCPKCVGDGIHPHAKPIERTFYALHIADPRAREEYSWNDKITQDEVDHLIAEGRLRTWRDEAWHSDPRTAEEINAANKRPSLLDSHDGINRWILVKYRCEKLGIPYTCDVCEGHGNIATEAERTEHAKWEATEPPAGDGWQLWETTSEGSPQSPVFKTADDLAAWCAVNATIFADQTLTREEWLHSFVGGTTDVDSMLVVRMPA